ncbi:hypothetical protein ACHAXA_004486 [Cyclostephanos tholiformis]|uniref:Orc1-like AAA ATPase domain-containing protein n=1 Tax=Cyclostephanos tholiformis TaxID=382380 RepID=A0ABD3RYT4_9STRA
MTSLRVWIEEALEAVDISGLADGPFVSSSSSLSPDRNGWPSNIRKSLALSSDNYLRSALRVARSLADQLCRDEADELKNGGSGRRRSPLLAAAIDWADRTVVHLSSNEKNRGVPGCDGTPYDEVDVQPLPLSSKSDPRELQAMLNFLISDQSLYTREDDENQAAPESVEAGKQNIVSYHNVAWAEILPFSAEYKSCGNVRDRDEFHRIYSLGLVFYELFSGGERPPVTKVINGETLPYYDQASSIDFSRRLSFSDQPGDIGDSSIQISDVHPIPRKKKASPILSTLCSITIETLKRKGVPVSLSSLIGNMIDCVNGDLSGRDAYRTMSDVRSDLQLMLDKPDRFLYDMDVEKLAVTGLQLNEAVFDRTTDYSALQNSYRRSISGEYEFAVIVGPSGIGKTVLANRLGSFASVDGALFLTGKFDQLQQTTPFSALASAFSEYCNQMAKGCRYNDLELVASNLRVALGGEARHLVKVIPNLSAVLGEGADQYEDQDCANAQARIQHLLCLFVDVISSFSGVPVLLFLDDLQWSDPASLGAMNQLLKYLRASSNSKRQFFFLGSCREEGLFEEHPLESTLTSIRQFGVHATVIKLACFDKDTTNQMVSDLLCLFPRLTRTLSEIIHHKSQGNPFFFSQLMTSLCRDGLVRLSLSRRRWEWDEDKIQSTKLPDDVAELLSLNIERSSNEVQNALSVLSCFGARSDCVIMKILEAKLGIPLIKPLQVAVAEGIINLVDGSYSFGHDRLQEAAYSMMNPADRCLFHFKYGVALVPSALDLEDDAILFTAANQINLGGVAPVRDSEQAVLIANLNLTAGCKAMEMSDFPSAYSFLDHGISFLPKGHWQDHYDLSLQIFDAASKCALLNGNFSNFNILTDECLKSAKRFEDKLNTMFNKVTALFYTSKLSESFKICVDVISQLGEPLPESSSEMDVKFHVEQTKVMLQGFSEERELIEYKRMTDPYKIMAMKFLKRLVACAQFARPQIVPLVTVKIVQLSIVHGISPVSSIGFAYFGQLLAKLGNVQEGCRYVNIAKMMLDRMGSKEMAGDVIVIASQVLCLVEPLQAIVEFHAEGFTIALAAGDLFAASGNLLFYCTESFWSGVKLADCKERFNRTLRLMETRGNMTVYASIMMMEEKLDLLMGADEGEDKSSITDDSEIQAAQDLRETNPLFRRSFFFQKMYVYFTFCESAKMKEFAELFFMTSDPVIWASYHYMTMHKFYGGLVAFRLYRETKNPIWAERGQAAKFATKKWAESSRHNFQHRVYLLEAEEAFCNNDIEHAQLLYENAISAARKHHFINFEALAYELTAYFSLASSKKDMALQYFLHAHEKYHDWGAFAKCNALFQFVQTVSGLNLGSTRTAFDSLPLSNSQGASDEKSQRKRVSTRSA